MTLGSLLERLDRSFPEIIYKTVVNLPDEGYKDISIGSCYYSHYPFPKLEPLDKKDYSFDDEIYDYVVTNETLIVWYRTERIK